MLKKKHEENLERRISEIRKELDAAEEESLKLHKQALDSIKQIKESQAISDRYNYRSFNCYNVGELYFMPFMDAMQEKYNCEEKEAFYLARAIYQVWEEYLQDPNWHPLKVVHVNGQPKEIIDEDDPKLKNLKIQYGESVHEAVTEALTERMQYNPVERRAVEVLWNGKQNRPATLGEGIGKLVQLLQEWEERCFRTRRH
nr:PREDICTED: factor of DNA methylation 3-like [Daucus carota subsp. sativus]